jgi:hypothetical protein
MRETRVFDGDSTMEGKARFIFPAILSGIMAFLMTCVITYLNLGAIPDFVPRWLKAFTIAWPLAYLAALIATPFARRGTALILGLLAARKP